MGAIWRRGEQNQLNLVPTEAMIGSAGKVVVLNDYPVIILEDLTAEMFARGELVGAATAGIWEFSKGDIAFTQFANVFVDAGGKIAETGTYIGVAENAVSASDSTVMVVFDSFGPKPSAP